MPTYEYACKKCGEHLEVVQSFNDEPLTKCPACKGALRKVFGNVGIVFKGSGFYKTDSRPAGKTESSSSASASSDSKSSDSKSAETKSDTKAETKADTKKADGTKGPDTKKSEKSTAAAS